MKTLFIFLGLLASTAAYSGTEHGSGGNIVYCHAGEGTFEPLDYYEGRVIYGLTPTCPNCGNDEYEIAREKVRRLKNLDPNRAALYEEWVNSFKKESRPLQNTVLVPVNDFGYIPIPEGCRVHQLILQREPKVPHEGRYLLDEATWKRLSPSERAGMILHEVIYRDALRRGHRDSRYARYWTAIISSEEIQNFTPATYESLLTKTLMDTWVHYTGDSAFRFYDEKIGTKEEMTEFCHSLGMASDLSQSLQLRTMWRELVLGAIGKRVQLIPNEAQRTVWVSDWVAENGRVVLSRIATAIHTINPPAPIRAYALCVVRSN